MNNFLVYKITNPSGKFYIGVTNSFKRRMSEHLSDWKNRPEKIALHNSFSKYGYENHSKEILIKNMPKEMAYKIEEKLIQSLDSQNSKIGLNSRNGGLGGNMIDWSCDYYKTIIEKNKQKKIQEYLNVWEKRKPIILKLKSTHTIEEIAKHLNCSTTALCRYCKMFNIKIERKRKFDLHKIAQEIKPYYDKGLMNKEVIEITKYSKGTICRAKNILLNK